MDRESQTIEGDKPSPNSSRVRWKLGGVLSYVGQVEDHSGRNIHSLHQDRTIIKCRVISLEDKDHLNWRYASTFLYAFQSLQEALPPCTISNSVTNVSSPK
ncbi:hypothetical protein Tco_1391881 [Tanacetum coccineum]